MATAVEASATVIEQAVRHYVKFEAYLCWPDGGEHTPLGLSNLVRLYRKSDLEALIQGCQNQGLPVTWRDVDESDAKPVAQTRVDAKTGYFFFEEKTGEETIIEEVFDWFAGYKKIDEWPDEQGQRFYLAVEGCAVALPLWRAYVNNNGDPVQQSPNNYANSYFIDAANFGCLIELEVHEREVEGEPTLMWRMETAFAHRDGTFRSKGGNPYFRDVLSWRWTYAKVGKIPGEDVPRQHGLVTIHVIPLAAFDAREGAVRDYDERWTHHPGTDAQLHESIIELFNPPDNSPRLRWGLNVDADGRPARKQMFPRAFLDLRKCPKSAAVLDSVHISFFEFGLRTHRLSGPNLTLRSFAHNRDDAAQVPFGDAICLTEHDGQCRSRISIFDAAGFELISPIQPQCTQNVDTNREQRYEALQHVSGGYLTGDGKLVDYKLAPCWGPKRRRGGRIYTGGSSVTPMHRSYDDVEHHSWAPNIDRVRRLFYYHRDYFRKGGTGGIWSSARGADAHRHVGIDLYGFCMGGYGVNADDLQGEPMYTMRRGRVRRRSRNGLHYFYLTFKGADRWRQIDYMHAYETPAPGAAQLSAGESRHLMAWAGTFIGWAGSSGNANGPNVSSKHLHIYYHSFTEDPGSMTPAKAIPVNRIMYGSASWQYGEFSVSKSDPADLFQADTAVGAAGEQKNHYPWLRGRVVNSHDKPFKAEHVKIIAYDRSNGRRSPIDTADAEQTHVLAIATPNLKVGDDRGYFELHVPADTDVGLVVTRAFCAPADIGDDSDCVDVVREIGPYAANVRYNSATVGANGGEDLGEIKLEYRQSVTGTVVNPAGQPQGGKKVEIVDVASGETLGDGQTGADGRFEIAVSAGRLRVKVSGAETDVARRSPGSDVDVGQIQI
jgi:hypothetical protein